MKHLPFMLASLLFAGTLPGFGGEFFKVQKVDYIKKEPKKGPAVYSEAFKLGKDGKPTREKELTFIPCLEVRVKTEGQIRANATFAKAYFFDDNNKLIDKAEKPALVDRGSKGKYTTPVFYAESEAEILFFALPEKVQKHNGQWIALVVFGDPQGAAAETFPSGKVIESYEFPEKPYYLMRHERKERKVALDPVVSHVVKTRNEKQPQITLFLRPPIGMTDASEAKGVLAMCVLAQNVEDIRRRLQALDSKDDLGGVLRFAERNKLIILCWGSRSLWNPSKNWDEQSKDVNKEMEETFEDVSKAWGKGVEELVKKYGIPDRNYLLWGASGSAQYACRLALRKPEYFLAIHAHIPSSFDRPTVEANKILWCLTTGELEGGYERSLRFYQQCRELGYPMIYKAIIGLGHSGHPNAENLGLKFYEYALSVRDQRDAYETSLKDVFGSTIPSKEGESPREPWLESFRAPLYVGDIINQEMFPVEKVEMVPPGFLVQLPTKELADAWNKK